MSLEPRLLELMVCPVCKGPLQAHHDADNRLDELQCPADRLGFAVRDGVAMMVEQQARNLDAPPAEPARA